MANEFVIKNGYLSKGDSEITGSLIVTGGITGSLLGTASYAVTASLPLEGFIDASTFGNQLTLTKGDGSMVMLTLNTGSVNFAQNAATASYVNSLTQDVTITGSLLLTGSYISVVDYIDFNNTGIPTPTDQEGRIYWDEDNGTLSLGMHGGQVVQQIGLEDYYYVKNQTGTTILNGTVTYASGTLGASGRILADLMIADGTIPYYYTLGIATEDIVDGDDGYVTQFGLVRGINTTGSNGETWVDGDILYVSPTVAGTLTKFEPEAPNLRLQIAIVVSAATNGSIFVRPDIGSDVGSLHNVVDSTTNTSYGELFVKSGSVWTSTKQLTGSYGLTGSLNVTGGVIITGSLDITGSLFVTSQDTIVATNYPNSAPGEFTVDTDNGTFNSAFVYLNKVAGDPSRSFGELSAMSPKGRLNFHTKQQALGIVVSTDTDAIQPLGVHLHDSPLGAPLLGEGTYINISGSRIEQRGLVLITGSLEVTAGITGSLFGTASQALTASYVNPLTQNVIITGSVNIHNGNIGLRSNSYFLQGTTTGGVTVSLIGVNSSDLVYIGNQGLTNILADDTIISGSLTVTAGITAPSFIANYKIVSASYALTSTDTTIEVVEAFITQSLPSAVGLLGKEYSIINATTGSVLIVANGSETIGNQASGNSSTITLYSEDAPRLISNNSNWRFI